MIYKHPLKISKIRQLLASSAQPHKEKELVVNPQRYVEAHYLAQILWQLELDCPRVDRDFVKKLHSGNARWKTKNGKMISLTQDFEFELLEELGIIICEHNWVRLNARLPDISKYKDYDDSVIPVLSFANSLREILNGYPHHSNLRRVTFLIPKERFNKIVPESFNFSHYDVNFEDVGSGYTVEIKEDGWGNGVDICNYFWQIFHLQPDVDKAIDKFYDLRIRYGQVIRFPNENSFPREETSFLERLYEKCIDDSKLIAFSLPEYQNYLMSENSFDIVLLNTSHTININFSNNNSNKNEIKQVPRTVTEIKEFYNNIDIPKVDSDYDLLNWSDRYSYNHCIYDDLAYLSLRNISKKSIYFDDNHVGGNYDVIDTILKKSIYLPVLRIYLIKHIALDSDNNFNFYMLSNPDLVHIGFNNLLNEVKTKFSSNDEDYKETIANMVSLICKTVINLSKNNNNISLISPIIIELVKGNIGKYKNINEVDMQCLEMFFDYIDSEDSVNLFSEIIIRLKNEDVEEGSRYKIYLLFKILSYCDCPSSFITNSTIKKDTLDYLISYYSKLIKISFESNNIHLSSSSFYDNLEWSCIDNEESINEFISSLPSTNDIIINYFKANDSSKLNYVSSISHYVQLLVNLLTLEKSNKSKLFKIIKDISLFFGFKKEEIPYPIFSDYFPSLHKKNYDLWNSLTQALDHIDFNEFVEFIDDIKGVSSASVILNVYSNTGFQRRKDYISDILRNSSQLFADEPSTNDLEKGFLLALEQINLPLAEMILGKAKEFFEEHKYKENIVYKERLFKWKILEYKYELLVIYYSDSTYEEKWEELIKVKTPRSEFEYNGENKESKLFYKYILGLTKVHYEPKTSLIIFENLYREYKSVDFSYLIFLAEVSVLEQKKSTPEEFKNSIVSYEQRSETCDFLSLDVEKKAFYINVLSLSKQYTVLKSKFLQLTLIEQNSKSIVLTYSKSLREIGEFEGSKKVIDSYKKFNAPYEYDPDIEEEYKLLTSELKSSFKTRNIDYIHSVSGVGINEELLNVRLLRSTFNEIKGRPAKELSQIISSTCEDLDKFLFLEMTSCAKEILSRATNLKVLKDKKNEDIVNDWFISLFNFRFSYFNPYINEQRRMGKSDTKNSAGIGELDGLIIDGLNGPISIYEAMNLTCLDNTVINKHLNKLSKYDTIGLSPIFVVSFCYFKEFLHKSKEYFDLLKTKQYAGFDDIDSGTHILKVLETTAYLATAVEYRYRRGQKVSIFHILIDLNTD